jgi:TonB family protein
MKLGDLAVKRHQPAEAKAFYSQAVSLGDTPETAPALIYLAWQTKDTAQSKALLDRAIAAAQTGPVAGRALTFRANYALDDGFPGVAETHYQEALAQDPPNSPEAAFTMESYAKLLTSQSRTGEAQTMQQSARTIRETRVAEISPKWTSADPVVKVGGGTSAPKLISKQEPEYSEEARAAKLQGTVVLRVIIGSDGQPYGLTLVQSLGLGLDEQAAEAVSQWKFMPGTRDGMPVSVEATIEVNFRLL